MCNCMHAEPKKTKVFLGISNGSVINRHTWNYSCLFYPCRKSRHSSGKYLLFFEITFYDHVNRKFNFELYFNYEKTVYNLFLNSLYLNIFKH